MDDRQLDVASESWYQADCTKDLIALAAVSSIWRFRADPIVGEYCELGERMRTVVLKANDESALKALPPKLDKAGVKFVLWTEHPEAIITALATIPVRRSAVGKLFRHFQLFR